MLWYIITTKYKYNHLNIEKLPDIELFTSKNIPFYIPNSYKAVIIVFFKSDCQYCLDEIRQLSDSETIFEKAQVYCVTVEPVEYLKDIESNFFLSQIIFLQDREKYLYDALSVKHYPSAYLFTSDRKFIKRFTGFAHVNEITSYIPNEQTD
jgi:peroxiredoxin